MQDSLLCLNSEWQGCESPILEQGSIILAKELFKNRPFSVLDGGNSDDLNTQDGVFALNSIGARFLKTSTLLEDISPNRIMTVGGSCGVEAAPVTYLNNYYHGDLAVVWLDAHGDLNTPSSSPSGHFHGMVLRTLLGDGPEVFCDNLKRPLLSEQVFLAGARDLDESEKIYIQNSNIKTSDVNQSLASLIASSGFQHVYIHFDVDVINPDDFSDALMPTANGPTLKSIAECISAINTQLDIVGIGIVEYCGQHSNSSKQISTMLDASGIKR